LFTLFIEFFPAFYTKKKKLDFYPLDYPNSFDIFVGSDRYTSPNMHTIHLPVPLNQPLPQIPSSIDLCNHYWADDRYPYLPFIFESPLFGPLMGRFQTFGRPSLQKGSRGWHLLSDTAKNWKTFEQLLRLTGEKLLHFFKETFPHIECIWSIPEKPSAYGYFTAHDSEDKAFDAVKDSIRGFVIYAAYLSFLICLFKCHRRAGGWDYYTVSTLLHDAQISPHPAWASDLEESGIGNFNNGRRRIGAIIDIPQCRWRNLIPYMIKLDIPLWFYWGTKPFAGLSGTWADRFRPNPTVREPGVPPPTQRVNPSFPPVIPNSGQRPGEDMKTYFVRRTAENQRRMATETLQAKQSRLDREAKQSKKQCPGKKGPTVFQWVNNDGIRIREPVSRRQVEDLWDIYSSHQMKYDGFSNQFDICTDFEDGPVDMGNDSDSDYEISPKLPAAPAVVDMAMSSPAPPPPSQPFPPHFQPPASQLSPFRQPLTPSTLPSLPNEREPWSVSLDHSQELASQTEMDPGNIEKSMAVEDGPEVDADNVEKSIVAEQPLEADDDMQTQDIFKISVQDILTRNPIITAEEPPPEVQFLEDLVYYRYGFFLDEAPYESPKGIIITVKDWSSVCRSVGGHHLDLSSKKNQSPITDFVNILANIDRPFHKVPTKYWDLSADNYGFLSKQDNHFRIEVKDFGDEVLCFLHPRNLESSKCPAWILAVPPMTALECIRRRLGPDPYMLAEYLTTHGMEFRTLQRLASRPANARPGNSSSTPILGKRPLGYKYDSADFAKYLTVRDSYLEGCSHARRALSIGGLIARLAREVLPISAILMGPSQDALEGKQDVLCCGDEVYVDDGLSEEASQVICGTYTQATNTISMSFIWFPVYCH
jgi:hypothetical protein